MSTLTTEVLLRAYSVGLFPMAERRDDPTLYWIDPEKRGILPLDDFHIPRRLRRVVRSEKFKVRCDTAFAAVIAGCAEQSPGRDESWINAEIVGLYCELHGMGRAHSVECWRDDTLVGGLYGITLGSVFFGESMFSRVPDASKVALVHLLARLLAGGFTLLDVQFVTPHLSRFGAVEVHRSGYRQMLADALERRGIFHREMTLSAVETVLQPTTQTS